MPVCGEEFCSEGVIFGRGRKADLMCIIGVIEDARFKRKEALADLAKAVKK